MFLDPGSTFTADQMIESLLNSAVRIDTLSSGWPFPQTDTGLVKEFLVETTGLFLFSPTLSPLTWTTSLNARNN